jgi:hypothetical protein
MLTLGGFVVVLSGYVSFAARREGASFQRALLGGALSAAVLRSIVTGGTVWLEGVAIIELAMTIWALACVVSALGASAAGLFADRSLSRAGSLSRDPIYRKSSRPGRAGNKRLQLALLSRLPITAVRWR